MEGSAQHATVVLDLLTHWKLELGQRPRRALYDPPPGWRPMPNALTTTWFPRGFRVTASELITLPDDQRAWIDGVLGDAERISDEELRTKTGWPMRIVITHAGDTWRAHAFYAFFEHAAVATLTAHSEDRLRASVPVLRTAQPCWRDGIAALSELCD